MFVGTDVAMELYREALCEENERISKAELDRQFAGPNEFISQFPNKGFRILSASIRGNMVALYLYDDGWSLIECEEAKFNQYWKDKYLSDNFRKDKTPYDHCPFKQY